MQRSRIRALDAGRGAAMLFVFLSHFLEYYLTSHGKLTQLHFWWRFTMIASPTFMLISGITLGYLFSINKSNFAQTRRIFIDRGLFLITLAHVIIAFSWVPFLNFFHSHVLKELFITDTIGICLITGSLLISKVKSIGRFVLAMLNKLAESQLFSDIMANLEIIGKTSLFAFVIQYFMYFSVVVWLNPPYMRIWPLFFILTMFINIILIRLWYKKELNKYITVLNLSVWKNIFKETY